MDTFKFDLLDVLATGALFITVVLIFAILGQLTGYPSKGEWQYPITLAFGIAALPLLPRLLLLLKSSGSSIAIAGVKIDFAAVQGLPSFTLDANVVDPGLPIQDS